MAARTTQSAAESLAAREAAREAHGLRVTAVRKAEDQALRLGVLRASDLSQADDWAARAAAESEMLAGHVEAARLVLRRAMDDERAARDQLAARQADAKLMASDRERWDGAQTARALSREEEAAAEAFRPQKR